MAFDADIKHRAFVWRSSDPGTRARGRRIIADAQPTKGKTAINWAEVRWTDTGILLPWKTPAKFIAGYRWLWGKLGHLALM
jgi:hypothetical protein